MSDVFEEVEEGLRQDQTATFLKKYGLWLAGGVVAVLLGIAGYQVFGAWQTGQSHAAANEMAAAQELLAGGKTAEGEKALVDIAAKSGGGYKTAALMQLGGIKAGAGDTAAALKYYDDAAAASPTKQFRDAAKMKAAYIAADVEDFAKLEARVKPLIDEAGPFSFQARELLGLQAAANGDMDRARTELEYLTLAVDAPEGVRQRAQSILSTFPPKPAAAALAAAAPAGAGEKK